MMLIDHILNAFAWICISDAMWYPIQRALDINKRGCAALQWAWDFSIPDNNYKFETKIFGKYL